MNAPNDKHKVCTLKIKPSFQGYGFNLHTNTNVAGQFIGTVDKGSPAEDAGLIAGDKVVSVNNIYTVDISHPEVVQIIKSVKNTVTIMTVDKNSTYPPPPKKNVSNQINGETDLPNGKISDNDHTYQLPEIDSPHSYSKTDTGFTNVDNDIQYTDEDPYPTDVPRGVFKCLICEKSYATSSDFNKHLSLHKEEKPYKCNRCEKSFSTIDDLNEHLPMHSESDKFKCGNCEKSFPSINYLKVHMLIHKGEEKFKCGICDKLLGTAGHLNTHLQKHSLEIDHTCDSCEKKFINLSNLKRHLQKHAPGENYKCLKCDEKFDNHCNLKIHRKCHYIEKKFKCNDCLKAFQNKSNLNRHLQLHNRERKYKCIIYKKQNPFNISSGVNGFQKDENPEEIKCHSWENH